MIEKEAFLKIAHQFQLGHLITEKMHSGTIGLAELAQNDLTGALNVFKRADLSALELLIQKSAELQVLSLDIKSCLDKGGRIYISGCGATGRLALALETFNREGFFKGIDPDSIIGFMAGGDAALIRSIEQFEDHPEFGERQLTECGFTDDDMLIAVTEGGETPFVLGTCEAAANINGSHTTWLLFCNPQSLLVSTLERCRSAIGHENVRTLDLTIGPMALSGSTRLQATTIQLLVLVACLESYSKRTKPIATLRSFTNEVINTKYTALAPFIEFEATTYQNGRYINYETDIYGITVLTDTTERAPTFSLDPFEKLHQKDEKASLSYMTLDGASESKEAWERLLLRPPRTLDWNPSIAEKAGMDALIQRDISKAGLAIRETNLGKENIEQFSINGSEMFWTAGKITHEWNPMIHNKALRHLILKVLLNAHSTLLMGRLGRYKSNIMTWVRPSNNKLIDRAARYKQLLHQHVKGSELQYERAVEQVFAELSSD